MIVKRSPLQVKQIFNIDTKKILSKLAIPKPFKLTLVQKRPRTQVNSKVIKLTCYDFHEAFDPQKEYNRILSCLELPYKSLQNITAKVKGDLAPHTLHLRIPLDELEGITDYTKLLASIGYYSVIDQEKFHLFINKRRPVAESNNKPNINIIETSTEEEAHEAMLLRSLGHRHPGMQNTYQDPPLQLIKKNSKYYFN